MSERQTPSQKMHSTVNPLPYSSQEGGESKLTYIMKLIIGTPIPFLLIIYSAAMLTSMSAMEASGWGAALLTFLYILVDRGSKIKEFHFFNLGVDFSLIGFLLIIAIGLRVNAPEADFIKHMGSVRWIIMLYLLTYSFVLFPGLNRLFYVIITLGLLIGGYGIFQHFTGIDLRYDFGLRAESAVTKAPFTDADVYQSVGLMSHHLTYGYLFSMVLCFPLAGLMLSRFRSPLLRIFFGVTTVAIALSLVWTYGRGVWIATISATVFMSTYVSRKVLFSFIIIAGIIFGTFYSSNHGFRERVDSIWDNKYTSNADRQDLWRANTQMLSDHPWIGIGWNQNEGRIFEYYEKLGITNKFGGHAHNNYLQILANSGILGFACYMLFIIGFLLMTHRLWTEIPKSHFWHRVFALGALGTQVSLHAGGLTQWNFGDAEVNHFFIFVLAVVAYMSQKYAVGVVPDDHSL